MPRDLMVLNGADDYSSDDASYAGGEYVTGAGRVGVLVAEMEQRTQRIFATAAEGQIPTVAQRPEDMPVTRQEAEQGMQYIGQQTAQAIEGVAAGTAQAVNTLAQEAAAAVSHTAASAELATSTLEARTAEAFDKTEEYIVDLQNRLKAQTSQIDQMSKNLEKEKRRHDASEKIQRRVADQKIADLSTRLDQALTRIDELSVSLATAQSRQEPTIGHPQHLASRIPIDPQPEMTVPPHLQRQEEIRASPAPSRRSSRRSRSSHRSRSESRHSSGSRGIH